MLLQYVAHAKLGKITLTFKKVYLCCQLFLLSCGLANVDPIHRNEQGCPTRKAAKLSSKLRILGSNKVVSFIISSCIAYRYVILGIPRSPLELLLRVLQILVGQLSCSFTDEASIP